MMTTTSSQAAQANKPAIPIRRIEFQLDRSTLPQDYYAGDAQLTAVMNALSTFFPDGESFFVDAVRHYKDRITDPDLLADIAGFVGQEAAHSAQHEAFNALLDAQGLPRSKQLGIDLAAFLLNRGRKLPMSIQLAATCGLEHFTAMLAEQILTRPEHAAQLQGVAKELWLWHALEESEHKSVAFDVYQQVNGSRLLLGVVLVPVTVLLAGATVITWAAMVNERRAWGSPVQLAKTAWYLFGTNGIFSSLIPEWFAYFHPRFHPSQTDAGMGDAPERMRDYLFGDTGLLKAKLRQVRTPPRRQPALA